MQAFQHTYKQYLQVWKCSKVQVKLFLGMLLRTWVQLHSFLRSLYIYGDKQSAS